jgi:hypothetical protein
MADVAYPWARRPAVLMAVRLLAFLSVLQYSLSCTNSCGVQASTIACLASVAFLVVSPSNINPALELNLFQAISAAVPLHVGGRPEGSEPLLQQQVNVLALMVDSKVCCWHGLVVHVLVSA